ncbi:ABC transporter permease [Metaclostridioides mangenotii]|jgi:ABC-2 type transport system permease protein|uniref:ABC-2 type transport system permease protein n=1 Tax=Metaclostridioides mangenotii TaxID=1540 RepID=A0ABS4ECK3_9FIRM|nr:ABC transporter permease [Clostridioides mangenotii]MBP1855683.1 ABC-2 type transport system permease protein [Clostridioides mangenotii]
MRINAIVTRIIRQFFRDKRTLALLIFAPILILTLMNFVFTDNEAGVNIGVENKQIAEILSFMESDKNIYVMTKREAEEKFKEKDLDAYISKESSKINILLNGSDSSISSQVVKDIQSAIKKNVPTNMNSLELKIDSYYGSDDMNTLDYLGPLLIGFFIFFFVFLISGVSFLRERTTGTLERLLATPIRRYEVVLGYLIGFGVFTILQSAIISSYSIWVLEIYNVGNIGLILVISIVIALCALSFGMFISAFANNELQIIQFIPIVIVPQAFFAGIFPIRGMEEALQILSKCMPLTYAGEALRDVMTCGASIYDVAPDLLVLLGFTVVFGVLNVFALKKHRIW